MRALKQLFTSEQWIAAAVAASILLIPSQAEAAQPSAKHTTQTKAGKKKVAKAAPSKRASTKRLASTPAKVTHLTASKRGKAQTSLRRASLEPSPVTREPQLASSAALVIDARNGQHIFEKNIGNVSPIASITKLMTAMVVLDLQLPLNELITITQDDVDTLKNSSSRLLVGTTLTRGEVLHLALMASENRAAHALARTSPIGKDAFIARMNRMAAALNMRSSHFVDPTGLNSNNVSTAEDLTRMVEAAHQYPEIRAYSTSDSMSFVSSVNRREYEFHNTNPLVKSDDWQIGVSKTGYISEAGKCLVMRATIKETPVVIVLLDSNGKLTRIGDAIRIKRWMESGAPRSKAS
ncbi:serine hydrolase [Burkholderiaceae bacterium DAT-1]|nr:serine hydrolase [Burkholderiaceae bacterium DAT-1]